MLLDAIGQAITKINREADYFSVGRLIGKWRLRVTIAEPDGAGLSDFLQRAFRALRDACHGRQKAEKKAQEVLEQERKLRHEREMELRRRVEFTRALVHELRAPLTSMLASSEMLVAECTEGTLLRLARNINQSTANLSEKIDELFDLSRGEVGP